MYCVYILASKPYGTLYVGVTNDLLRRVIEHREGLCPGFTKRYGVARLVWFDAFEHILDAIALEKQVKRWRREWKFNLIERENPHWVDLYPLLIERGDPDGPLYGFRFDPADGSNK